MKQWKKDIGEHQRKSDDLLLSLAILTGLTGFVINEWILFLPTALFLTMIVVGKWYDRYGGRQLEFVNHKQTIRAFPGDEAEVRLQLKNGSLIPILNGELSFKTDTVITSQQTRVREQRKEYVHSLPLSLVSKGMTGVTMPIVAKRRGVTKLSALHYRFPHLVRFAPVTLNFQPAVQTEVIVYPEQKPIYGVEEVFQMSIGDQTSSVSRFENALMPIGTRDYVSSDPFHKVHWKASAKTQQLQTKVLEKQVDMSWMILVNVTERTKLGNRHVSNHLEDLLSYASFLAYYASKRDYSYELALNMRRPHDTPYYYQPEGNGTAHLKHSLELLARIRSDHLTLPMEEFMYRVNHHLYKRKTVVILGEIPEECQHYMKDWKRRGIRLFHLNPEGDQPILMPAEGRTGS
ncbi:DUF58 domain-containing protein [Halobacillus fulvus]|nr:DUF58 domain-containing protein [Halobacillus fulvus]